MLKNFWKW